MSLTHAELCERARRWLGSRGRCPIVLVEFTTLLGEIPDAIGFRNSGRDFLLIECKASRSDFLSDRKKRHRRKPDAALGSYRWFMCEPDVIRPDDLPDRWGLLYVRGRRVELVAGADPKRTYWTDDPWRWPDCSGEHTLMFSALRRLQLELGTETFRTAVHRTFAERNEVSGPTPTEQAAAVRKSVESWMEKTDV